MYQPEKLKARRKELKLTQKEIAEQLGISFQAYSAWERGVKEPSEEKVKQLEEILKVPKGKSKLFVFITAFPIKGKRRWWSMLEIWLKKNKPRR